MLLRSHFDTGTESEVATLMLRFGTVAGPNQGLSRNSAVYCLPRTTENSTHDAIRKSVLPRNARLEARECGYIL